jgi:hypothetical protein
MANAGYKVAGIGRSSGEYEGRNYDNTILHVLYQHEKVQGTAVKLVKVKTSVYLENPVKVGDVFDFNCNEFRQVKEIVKL